jgi:hypothetical protein
VAIHPERLGVPLMRSGIAKRESGHPDGDGDARGRPAALPGRTAVYPRVADAAGHAVAFSTADPARAPVAQWIEQRLFSPRTGRLVGERPPGRREQVEQARALGPGRPPFAASCSARPRSHPLTGRPWRAFAASAGCKWIDQALKPIAAEIEPDSLRRLTNALALCTGAEA